MPGPDGGPDYGQGPASDDGRTSEARHPSDGAASSVPPRVAPSQEDVVSGAGLRKRRTDRFVTLGNDITNDERMSYRALGLLTHLLAKPDGWDVRSEVLARGAGREGREAIRTALRELGTLGHYRLERRRLRDGRVVMGTAISEEPVEGWAADWAAADGKAVLVWEQEDGTFTGDHPLAEVHPIAVGAGDGFLGAGTGDGKPGAGKPGAGRPGAGKPDAGAPDAGSTGAGNLGALVRQSTKDDHQDDQPEQTQLLPPPPATALPPGSTPAPTGPDDLADKVAEWWWEGLDPKPVVAGRGTGYPGFRSMIRGAIRAGFTQGEIARALRALKDRDGTVWPSKQQLDRACRAIRTGQQPPGRTPNRHTDTSPAAATRRDARRAQFGDQEGPS